LMERHSVNERRAFDMLRDEARRSQRKVVDVAEGVASSHQLLPSESDSAPGDGPTARGTTTD